MTTYTFSCGCSCEVDSFYTVPVRTSFLVCPVHQKRELEQGSPETLAFFSDVEVVDPLEAAKARLASDLDYALAPTQGNDPVRSALLRRRAAILAATTWEKLEAAGKSA